MRLMLPALLAALCSTPVSAEMEPMIVMETQTVTIRFAPPPWSDTRDIGDTSTVSHVEGQSAAGIPKTLFQLIPNGETFEDWQQLYLMSAEEVGEGRFDQFVNGQINTYARACDKAALYHDHEVSARVQVYIVFCNAYTDRPDQGEVGIFRIELAAGTLVQVAHHIRVPAFDMGQASTRPPVSVDRLRAALVRIGRARVIARAAL